MIALYGYCTGGEFLLELVVQTKEAATDVTILG